MSRLRRADWLRAAQRTLVTHGLAGVRIEVLARDLGVSKGSFYWHFADRAALLEALLAAWEAESDWLIAESRQAPTAPKRLARLLALIAAAGGPHGNDVSDPAIFLWARQDAQVAARVAAVEERRIAYLEELLRGHGIAPAAARRRAAFASAAFNGYVEQLTRGVATLRFEDFQVIVTSVFAMHLPADGE
jgi:AcrR family transcriptional regulator